MSTAESIQRIQVCGYELIFDPMLNKGSGSESLQITHTGKRLMTRHLQKKETRSLASRGGSDNEQFLLHGSSFHD